MDHSPKDHRWHLETINENVVSVASMNHRTVVKVEHFCPSFVLQLRVIQMKAATIPSTWLVHESWHVTQCVSFAPCKLQSGSILSDQWGGNQVNWKNSTSFSLKGSPCQLLQLPYRRNTCLTKLPLVSVRRPYGRVTQRKSFTSSASSIFLWTTYLATNASNERISESIEAEYWICWLSFWRLKSVNTNCENCPWIRHMCSNRWPEIKVTAQQKNTLDPCVVPSNILHLVKWLNKMNYASHDQACTSFTREDNFPKLNWLLYNHSHIIFNPKSKQRISQEFHTALLDNRLQSTLALCLVSGFLWTSRSVAVFN